MLFFTLGSWRGRLMWWDGAVRRGRIWVLVLAGFLVGL